VFDWFGLYSCEPFDFRKEPEHLITIIAGYSMVSDEELGVNEFLREDGGNKYILFGEKIPQVRQGDFT
jgi:Fungal protein kinase